jgi:hypothetical protein
VRPTIPDPVVSDETQDYIGERVRAAKIYTGQPSLRKEEEAFNLHKKAAMIAHRGFDRIHQATE